MALRILASGFVFYGVSMVLSQALNGAGDTKTPTRLNLLCFWFFQIPLAYYLVKYTSLGATGAMIAIPISHAALTVFAWFVFRSGKWREVKV
jgi:Na+-driven multidrug efflux pump